MIELLLNEVWSYSELLIEDKVDLLSGGSRWQDQDIYGKLTKYKEWVKTNEKGFLSEFTDIFLCENELTKGSELTKDNETYKIEGEIYDSPYSNIKLYQVTRI